MTNFPEYTDTDYVALGHYLRREMFGVELNEEENCMATMSILKFGNEIDKISPKNMVLDKYNPSVIDNPIAVVEVGELFGVADKSGWLCFPKYNLFMQYFCDDVAVVVSKGLWGAINTKGEEIIAPKYHQIHYYNGFFKVSLMIEYPDEMKFGFFTKTGEILGDGFVYDSADRFVGGCASVQIGDKWGYINEKGELLGGKCLYDKAEFFYDGEYAVVRIKNKYGIVNKSGELLGKGLIYSEAGNFVNGFARVKLKGKYGFIDKQGNFYDKLP